MLRAFSANWVDKILTRVYQQNINIPTQVADPLAELEKVIMWVADLLASSDSTTGKSAVKKEPSDTQQFTEVLKQFTNAINRGYQGNGGGGGAYTGGANRGGP